MKIQLMAKQLELSSELQNFLEKKILSLGKFVKRLEKKGELLISIEISKSTEHHRHGNIYYAEATMPLPKKILRAEHYGINIQTAIDGVKDKIKLEIKKYKDIHILKNTRDKKIMSRLKKTDQE